MPAESPTISSRSSIVPTAAGGRFGTTTGKLCSALRPVGSVATIVTRTIPGEIAVTVTPLPVATAAATPGSELKTSKASISPSGVGIVEAQVHGNRLAHHDRLLRDRPANRRVQGAIARYDPDRG